MEQRLKELKEQYKKEYKAMEQKICPFRTESIYNEEFRVAISESPLCAMECCMAFAGECDIQENSHKVVLPHCMRILDTGMLYELAEISRPVCSEHELERWRTLEDMKYNHQMIPPEIQELRKKQGLDKDTDED